MSHQLLKQTKDKSVIIKSDSKYNLLHEMENIVYNYIVLKEDKKRANLHPLRNPSHLKSYTFRKYPYGYFCCYDAYNNNKLIIYNKQKGYFWDTVKFVFSLEVILNNNYSFDFQRDYHQILGFEEVLNELEMNF